MRVSPSCISIDCFLIPILSATLLKWVYRLFKHFLSVAEQFITYSEPQFSIATNHHSVIGIVWGRDYNNENSVAYIFVGSVGGKKVFMYEIGKQGNPSITATISGRDITFTTNSLDEFFYFKF